MPKNKLSKYFFYRDQIFIFFGGLLFVGAGILNLQLEKPVLQLSKQDSAININKDLLVFMSAGNKRLITDLLWVQTLIESDLEHYGKKDLNNWLFLRFNTISILDPYFYQNYLFGGQFLAIVKDDLFGADIIYKKGVSVYPEDYYLNYHAGFLNYYEMNRPKEGIKYLQKIVDHPKSPVFIRSIINKLLLATGIDIEEIFKLVLYNYETTEDKILKQKLRGDLYSIKAEIDLKCLNNQKESCDLKDLDGNFYIKQGKSYIAAKKFLLYRINKRGETTSPLQRSEINTIK